MNFVGPEEINIFTPQHDVYPLIDPKPHFDSQSFKDKVIIVTGSSTGIGATTALFYARAGARVVLNAPRAEDLEERKAVIEKDVPSAQMLFVAGDISDPEVGRRLVETAVETWGRLDIVVANAAYTMGAADKLGDKDALAWWHTQEVNVRGTLNIVHPAIPHLLKTKGQVLVTTSCVAHFRMTLMMDYSISKHTLNRFVEMLAIDYPELSFYAVHPGTISTLGQLEWQGKVGMTGKLPMPDSLELPAATYLWLTARNAEFLNGRYVQAPWDLNEVLAKKDEIVRDNLLVTKLAGPAKSA